ncbi:hypothetical protein [Dictyobacter aurantiacus]|uniref:Uncharacterized protein n=1 Tax=Dictyobacter aurantiacus TaxID=1936993 RepID=A0A401ZN36_9CHLR|nr:hypothetical protein [Dictyobacter aurantiacus]GCE08279.1 hypothetical protein KDAU_56080 [Dictyobacter aurantiacus]
MKPTDVSNAITQALVQGGAQWMVSTIVAFLPALWTMTLILHLGRPYVLRTLRRCGLRLGADVWWMSYLLMRDALLLVTFALSWIFFQPNIVAASALPITGPIAALLLLLALATKLSRRADDDVRAYRLVTIFLVLGATLYYGPQVFAVEAASQDWLAGFGQAFTSNTNTGSALVIMWICMAGVAIVAGWLFIRAWSAANRSMARRIAARKAPTAAPPEPAVS